jgi:hypothetical protein
VAKEFRTGSQLIAIIRKDPRWPVSIFIIDVTQVSIAGKTALSRGIIAYEA